MHGSRRFFGALLLVTGCGADPVTAPPAEKTQRASLVAGLTHACSIRVDGSLWCWGDGSFGKLGTSTSSASGSALQLGAGQSRLSVFAYETHTCAVRDVMLPISIVTIAVHIRHLPLSVPDIVFPAAAVTTLRRPRHSALPVLLPLLEASFVLCPVRLSIGEPQDSISMHSVIIPVPLIRDFVVVK